MKQILFTLILVAIFSNSFSQSISTVFQDESNGLNVIQGTTLISDDKANGGTCMLRSSGAADGTFWAGPYISVSAGNYLFQARIKVASNSASSNLFLLDIVSEYGLVMHGGLWITPNMFKANNEWQLITIPVSIPHGITNLEMRGMNFQPGVTDVYLDYVQLIPSGFSSFYSEQLTVSAKGDIGIGTSKPNEKLAVNGKIRAKEVKVEATNWPDYVFEEDYKVAALADLGIYIKTHKRLPEMPSAKEIMTNGLELGKIVNLQQKKIEELTLHLIDENNKAIIRDKETDELKTLIKKQQSRLVEIELKLKIK